MDKNKLNGKSVTKESLQCLREKKKKWEAGQRTCLLHFLCFLFQSLENKTFRQSRCRKEILMS